MLDTLEEFKREVATCLGVDVRELEEPPNSVFGDIAYPCFNAAKLARKDPRKLALKIGKKINIRDKRLIARFEVVGPYINFFVNWENFNRKLLKRINANYGKGRIKKIALIDYSSPNPVHPWHLGTLRSTLLGESLARILEFAGWLVRRICYINDLGKQVAFLLYGYMQNPRKPVGKPDVWLGELYFKACKELKEKEVQEVLKRYEFGDEEIRSLGKKIFTWCLEGFAQNWQSLGIKFDGTIWESRFVKAGRQIVRELEKRKLVFESAGAKVVHLEPYGLSSTIIQRADGTGLYLTRDIPFALWKASFKPNLNIYVVAEDQSLHFKQLFKILELLGHKKLAKTSIHIPFAMVTLRGKKMSSRLGKVVLFDDLLEEGKKKALSEVKKRWPKLPVAEMEKRAVKISIAAINYFILRYSPEKTVDFDWARALAFEGNTGPYLQYTYARACSIIKKAVNRKVRWADHDPGLLRKKEEIMIIKKLAKFPSILAHAAGSLQTHIIASYTYELCELFNSFYHSLRVLQAESELRKARLALVSAVRTVLHNCLNMLVIPVIEQM